MRRVSFRLGVFIRQKAFVTVTAGKCNFRMILGCQTAGNGAT